MTNNKVLESCLFIEGALEHTHHDTRTPITRGELRMIKGKLSNALINLSNAGADVMITIPLNKVLELVVEVLNDENLKDSADFVKDKIVSELQTILPQVYLYCGKYYETVEFDYNPAMTKVVNRVIDNCIRNGYYFGY